VSSPHLDGKGRSPLAWLHELAGGLRGEDVRYHRPQARSRRAFRARLSRRDANQRSSEPRLTLRDFIEQSFAGPFRPPAPHRRQAASAGALPTTAAISTSELRLVAIAARVLEVARGMWNFGPEEVDVSLVNRGTVDGLVGQPADQAGPPPRH